MFGPNSSTTPPSVPNHHIKLFCFTLQEVVSSQGSIPETFTQVISLIIMYLYTMHVATSPQTVSKNGRILIRDLSAWWKWIAHDCSFWSFAIHSCHKVYARYWNLHYLSVTFCCSQFMNVFGSRAKNCIVHPSKLNPSQHCHGSIFLVTWVSVYHKVSP